MEDYCRAVPAVGGLELGGRLVSEAAAGILGHDTVNMPSLRLALTSDSYTKKNSQSVSLLKTLWNPNGTTEGSKTQFLYWDKQLGLLSAILRCIPCTFCLLRYVV